MAVRWDLSLHDIVWTVFIDADYDGNVTWQEVQDARPAHRARACSRRCHCSAAARPARCTCKDFALASAQRTELPVRGAAGRLSATRAC